MAVFSNLEGTMKRSFILGKNGAKLSFDSGTLVVRNYQDTSLIPISAADPTSGTHLVTLQYLNTHGGGSGNTLRGTVDPDQSLGIDGDVYYKVDDTSILQIYIKDLGIWKPFSSAPAPDSDYVTTTVATPSEFQQVGSDYVYTLSSATHGRGSNIIVQLQGSTGDIQTANVTVDSSGNITVTSGTLPTGNINVVIIGETTLSTPYSQLINKADWSVSGSDFTLSIPQATHGQAAGAIFLAVYENSTDGATSASPYQITAVQTAIDGSGNITLTASVRFSGKVVISGK